MNTPEKVRASVLRALADAGLRIRDADLKTGVGPLRKDKNGLRRDPKIWLYGGPECRSVLAAVRVVKARMTNSAAMLPFVQRQYRPPSPMYSPANNLPPPAAGVDAPPSPAPSEASTTAMSPAAPGALPAQPVDVPPAPPVAAPPIPFVAAAPPVPNEAGALSDNKMVPMERLERLEQLFERLEQQTLNTSYTHGNMIRDIDANRRKTDAEVEKTKEEVKDIQNHERNNSQVLKVLKTKVDELRTLRW